MIRHRLKAAGLPGDRAIFTSEAIQAIHAFTQGYPRKIAKLCQRALEELLMREQWQCDDALVRELVSDECRWIQSGAA